jgi:hypothetical protein
MIAHTVRATLSDLNPDAILFDGLDAALVGFGGVAHNEPVAVYSKTKIFEQLMSDGLSPEDADEYFSFNIVGLWAGPHTPFILDDVVEQ